MFADYRVPQVLVHFGALQYDDHLVNLLKSGKKWSKDVNTYLTLSQCASTSSSHQILTNPTIQSNVLDKILDCGSAEEVEIRGASIYIVEELKKYVLAELAKNYPQVPTQNVNSILLDHFLWDFRRDHAAELEYIPFHKTIGIYY